MQKDFYKILGIAENAGQEDIKKAYRSLAKKYHPDKSKGGHASEEKFKAINEAYDTLKDSKKRAEYDQMRKSAESFAQGGGGGSAWNRAGAEGGQGGGYDFADLNDLFGGMFGQRGAYTRTDTQTGRDLMFEIQVPFETAVNGGEISIGVPREGTCSQCGGTGAQQGTTLDKCTACKGSGFIQKDGGRFNLSQICPLCSGRGKVPQKPCAQCRGSGVETRTDRVTVKIPKGIEDGARIRLEGQGETALSGEKAGDLYLLVHILPHPRFTRKGLDIYATERVDALQAMLGGYKKVQTLHGVMRLKIPGGIQPGAKLKLKGQGVKVQGGHAGDHYVEIQVSVPEDLTKEQRDMIKQVYEQRVGV